MIDRRKIARGLVFVSRLVGSPFVWMANKVNPCPIPDAELIKASYDADTGETKVSIRHEGVTALASAVADTFFDIGGSNYATMTMSSPKLGLFEVIIQRKSMGAKTPAEMVSILRGALNDIHDNCMCGATAAHVDLMDVVPFSGFDPPLGSEGERWNQR